MEPTSIVMIVMFAVIVLMVGSIAWVVTEDMRDDVFCGRYGYDISVFDSGVKYCKMLFVEEKFSFREVKDGRFGSGCNQLESCWKLKQKAESK